MQLFRGKGWKLIQFAETCWEILFKVIGQPLANAKKAWESLWEMLTGHWIASVQFLKATENNEA
jgi:hypothetical protein